MTTLTDLLNGKGLPNTENETTLGDLLNKPRVQGGAAARANPEYGEETQADRLAFAARMGFGDTWRGVKQLLGTDEEQMAEDQRRLNVYLENEEYGGSILAAYTGGLFGDPVGWVMPGMKARNAYKAMQSGLKYGGIAGATGYVDEEQGMNRLNNTLLGMAGGGVLSPAMYKFNTTIAPALARGYKNIGEKGVIDETLKSELNLLQRGIAAPIRGVKKTGEAIAENSPDVFKRFGNNIGGYIIENFGLPDAVVVAKGTRRQMENKWAGDFNDVLEKFDKLTPEQDRALYRLMTPDQGVELTPSQLDLLTPELRQLGKEGRTIVNKLGKELTDLGLLDPDTFIRNKKSYLYRSYESTQGPNAKNRRIIRDENNVGVIASEFVRRGRDETFRPAKGQTKKQLRAEKEAEGYRHINSKGQVGVTMNKDFTPEQRKQMGEIISSTFALAKTGKLMSNDVAAFKFYDDVSKMGDDVVAAKGIPDNEIPVGYKQIPEDFVGVGSRKTGIRRFGNLAGRYVSPEVHRDLVWADRMKRYRQGGDGISGAAKLHQKMLRYWKRTKTSLNPVVHMNNIMSNVVLYDLVNGNYKYLGSAGKDFFNAFARKGSNKVKSEDFRMAEKLGVFDADMMKRELGQFERDTYSKYMKLGKQKDDELLENLWEGTKKYAGKTHMDRLYSAEDGVFRLALFKDHLAKNVGKGIKPTDEQYAAAGKHARKYMLDYEINAPAVELMRESAMPFISYTYRAAPIIAETIIKRPWKIAKWGLILNAANDLAADDNEYKTERKRQKELDQSFDVLGIPGANTLIKLPNEKYLDVSRWIPAGDVLQVKDQGFSVPFVPTPLQPSGGALGGIAKIAVGFDTFTKQTVPGVGSGVFKDSFDARFGMQRDSMLGKEFIPLWNQGWNIYDAYAASGKEHPTKDDRSLNESLLGAVGIKVKTYNEEKSTMRVNFKYQNRIESLTKKMKKLAGNRQGGRIDKEDFDKDMKRLRKELNRIQKEASQAIKKVR